MNINQLDENLQKALDNFSIAFQNYDEDNKTVATEADINLLARQTLYALSEFREQIIQYLQSK